MGVFSERPEQQRQDWAGLPSEPYDVTDPPERLDEAPRLAPDDLGLGAQYSSVVIPVAPPAPEAADASDSGPGHGDVGRGDADGDGDDEPER
ncbi:hypothetical protein [Microbacterium neungamense]|uniref:hypothetical protein n=1 Tax=Microbacterium neungamense TaxID=2810535 RepID=UPI00217D9A53|nr:hypothetical protein [Microbacterium neungamense]UWF77626.1 hypothetical protein JSY13_00590 [Microbacterium neungamense]